MDDDQDEADWIEDDPITRRQFDRVLAPYLTRTDRRRFWRALEDADLIVFQD